MAGLRVLLVDDEVELVSTLAERLEIRGYEVETFTSGAEALERVGEASFDVAVVDLKMPGVSGIAVLDGIKKSRPDLPVILLTGHGLDSEGQAGLDHGAAGYLFKPVKLDVLMQTMDEATKGGPHE